MQNNAHTTYQLNSIFIFLCKSLEKITLRRFINDFEVIFLLTTRHYARTYRKNSQRVFKDRYFI